MEDDGRRQLSIAPDWEFPEQIDVTIGNRNVLTPKGADEWPDRTGLFRVIGLLGNPAPHDVWWQDYPIAEPLCYQVQEQRNPDATDFPEYRVGYLLVAFAEPETIQVQLFLVSEEKNEPVTESVPPAGFDMGNLTLEQPGEARVYFR